MLRFHSFRIALYCTVLRFVYDSGRPNHSAHSHGAIQTARLHVAPVISMPNATKTNKYILQEGYIQSTHLFPRCCCCAGSLLWGMPRSSVCTRRGGYETAAPVPSGGRSALRPGIGSSEKYVSFRAPCAVSRALGSNVSILLSR